MFKFMRMISLVENNYDIWKLGSRVTGKSHVCNEIFPYSFLVTEGKQH
ncbi:BREX system Lon protease-like protein BrxL [Lutispora thermophila]